jgi:predicted ArsR family transcriptional regulator
MATRWDERFFSSTRGQVAALLRPGGRTVDELAGELGLTDNAVRAHLAALERDGLVKQGEPRRGTGKPSYTFGLTPEAERLFPKAYGLLLNQLMSVLADRLSPQELTGALREVGHRIATTQTGGPADMSARVDWAVELLGALGGLAVAQESDGGFVIRGCDCPLAAAVEGTADACLIAEALLSEMIGAPVRQRCDPGPPPCCRFEVTPPTGATISETIHER